jgi:hypothetical protein
MTSRGLALLAGLALALLCARPARGGVTADLVLSARYWRTDWRHQARLDNVRLEADAEWRAPVSLHLDYDRQAGVDEKLSEAYGEWRGGKLRARAGRFLVPFGIYNRSELYYVGLVNPPILKEYLGGEYQVGRSEQGLSFVRSDGRWQLEAALFSDDGAWRAVIPSGGEGCLRLQYYTGAVVLGVSALRERGDESGTPEEGAARFFGLDFRFSRPSLILRGEVVSGSAPGGSPGGFYVDLLHRPPQIRNVTFVARVESARGLSGQPRYRRGTVGAKWDLGGGTAMALNQAFDSPRFQYGLNGTTVYLWHTHRL